MLQVEYEGALVPIRRGESRGDALARPTEQANEVADARRLTRFEARAVREGGWRIVSDSLVPVAIVAAYYGLKLAACGVVQAPLSDRE